MKQKHLASKRFTLLLFAFSLLLPFAAAAQFSGGNGTPSNPYIITTAAELDAVRNDLTANYKLGNNIDLTAYLSPAGAGYAQWGDDGWAPLGSYYFPGTPFSGSFDGDGYAITGLWINYGGCKACIY